MKFILVVVFTAFLGTVKCSQDFNGRTIFKSTSNTNSGKINSRFKEFNDHSTSSLNAIKEKRTGTIVIMILNINLLIWNYLKLLYISLIKSIDN